MGYAEQDNPHLEWDYDESQNRYYAMSVTEEEIVGFLHLRNWGRHVHWSWRQTGDFDLSPGCLEEVRKKQKELFKNRKQENKP